MTPEERASKRKQHRAGLLPEEKPCCTLCFEYWPCSVVRLLDTLDAAEARAAAAERASRTREDYDLRCQRCGAPHWLDTSIPTPVWNRIASPEDVLCLLCIDELLAEAGLACEAEFYFVGKAVRSRLYDDGSRAAAVDQAQKLVDLLADYVAACDRVDVAQDAYGDADDLDAQRALRELNGAKTEAGAAFDALRAAYRQSQQGASGE